MTRHCQTSFVIMTALGVCALGCQEAPRLPEKSANLSRPLPKGSDGWSTSMDSVQVVQAPATVQQTSQSSVVTSTGPTPAKEALTPPPASALPQRRSPSVLPVSATVPSSDVPLQAPPTSAQLSKAQPVMQARGSSGPIDELQPARASREPVEEALRCILEDRQSEALEHLKKYDATTQRLLLEMLRPLAIIARKKMNELGPQEIARLNDQLQELSQSLRPRTSLTIDQACFCQSVRSFGNYQPLPDGHVFQASTANRPGERVQFYVELKNFASMARDGAYETRLASSVEIHNAKGDKIWQHSFNDRQHPVRSRAPLHDYFNNYSFNVPPLSPGNYILTITIADETIADVRRDPARKSLEFRVGSPR